MNDSGFLALPLDAQNFTQQSNLQLLAKENLLTVDDCDNKAGWDWFCMGNRTSSAQESRCVGIQVCIYFVQLVFWHFQWLFSSYSLYRSCMAVRELNMKFSLQMVLFPLCYAMRTIMGMFSFAFWVWVIIIWNVKWVLLVVDSQHTWMPGQSVLCGTSILCRDAQLVCTCMLHTPHMTSLGFTVHVDHVGMTSVLFSLHRIKLGHTTQTCDQKL